MGKKPGINNKVGYKAISYLVKTRELIKLIVAINKVKAAL